MEVILVNARHIKNVPGRKTDISDCKWLAGLLRHGLLKGSFIPSKKIRQWRELTRLRRTYIESLADYKRRVHKLFETANIKIDSVVSDLFGVTGRNLISFKNIEDIIIDGKNKNQFRKNVNPRVFRNVFLGAFNHMALRWFILNKKKNVDMIKEIDHVVDLLSSAVLIDNNTN